MSESTPSTVEAKYPGLCLSCNNRWQPGEKIQREILEGIGHCYVHANCPPQASKIRHADRDGSLGTLRNRLRCFCHECHAFVDPGEGRVWLCEACTSGHDEPEWHTSHRDKDLCEHYKRDEPEAIVPKTPSWAEVSERYLVLDGRKLKLEVGSTVAELRKEMARAGVTVAQVLLTTKRSSEEAFLGGQLALEPVAIESGRYEYDRWSTCRMDPGELELEIAFGLGMDPGKSWEIKAKPGVRPIMSKGSWCLWSDRVISRHPGYRHEIPSSCPEVSEDAENLITQSWGSDSPHPAVGFKALLDVAKIEECKLLSQGPSRGHYARLEISQLSVRMRDGSLRTWYERASGYPEGYSYELVTRLAHFHADKVLELRQEMLDDVDPGGSHHGTELADHWHRAQAQLEARSLVFGDEDLAWARKLFLTGKTD